MPTDSQHQAALDAALAPYRTQEQVAAALGMASASFRSRRSRERADRKAREVETPLATDIPDPVAEVFGVDLWHVEQVDAMRRDLPRSVRGRPKGSPDRGPRAARGSRAPQGGTPD